MRASVHESASVQPFGRMMTANQLSKLVVCAWVHTGGEAQSAFTATHWLRDHGHIEWSDFNRVMKMLAVRIKRSRYQKIVFGDLPAEVQQLACWC